MRIDNIYTEQTKKSLEEQILKVSSECETLTPRAKAEVDRWLENSWIFFAEDSNEILGWVVREPISPFAMELKSLYVLPKYRNSGVGKSLLERATNQNKYTYLCATRTKLTHGILTVNGFKQIKLLGLKLNILMSYILSRKMKSIFKMFGKKTTFWIKNAY